MAAVSQWRMQALPIWEQHLVPAWTFRRISTDLEIRGSNWICRECLYTHRHTRLVFPRPCLCRIKMPEIGWYAGVSWCRRYSHHDEQHASLFRLQKRSRLHNVLELVPGKDRPFWKSLRWAWKIQLLASSASCLGTVDCIHEMVPLVWCTYLLHYDIYSLKPWWQVIYRKDWDQSNRYSKRSSGLKSTTSEVALMPGPSSLLFFDIGIQYVWKVDLQFLEAEASLQ